MRTYITIDSGTTSTRVNLLKNGEICDTVKLDIGARACIGNRGKYTEAIKTAIDEIVLRNNADRGNDCLFVTGYDFEGCC